MEDSKIHDFTSSQSDSKIIISMVGLPARGKTHTSRKLVRYLTWLGYEAKVYNIGNKRRQKVGVGQKCNAEFFSSENEEANRIREELAIETFMDCIKYLKRFG